MMGCLYVCMKAKAIAPSFLGWRALARVPKEGCIKEIWAVAPVVDESSVPSWRTMGHAHHINDTMDKGGPLLSMAKYMRLCKEPRASCLKRGVAYPCVTTQTRG